MPLGKKDIRYQKGTEGEVRIGSGSKDTDS